MTERVAPTYNNPTSPNRIILALAESNDRLSKSLLNLLSQPNQADSHLAGLVMKLQQELDFANERLEESKDSLEAREELEDVKRLNEQYEGYLNASNRAVYDLSDKLNAMHKDKHRLGEENESLRATIAEMKQHQESQTKQWSDTVQGLLVQREQLEIERDALKAENKELRRVFAEVQAAPVAA